MSRTYSTAWLRRWIGICAPTLSIPAHSPTGGADEGPPALVGGARCADDDVDAREVPMKTVVVYESMYGNTHLIAEAVAAGIREAEGSEVVVVPVDVAFPAVLADADLLV